MYRMLSHLGGFCVVFLLAECAIAEWAVEPVDLEGNSGWSVQVDVTPDGVPGAAYFTTDPNGYQRYSVRTAAGWQEDREVAFSDNFAYDPMGRPHFLSTPSPAFFPVLGRGRGELHVADRVESRRGRPDPRFR